MIQDSCSTYQLAELSIGKLGYAFVLWAHTHTHTDRQTETHLPISLITAPSLTCLGPELT